MERKKNSIRKKIIGFGLPSLILVFVIVSFIIIKVIGRITIDNAEKIASLITEKTDYEISKELSSTVGIIENIKVSIERGCNSTADIQKYVYSIADAYPDIIPTGVYCGLEDGTYIDKLWTPDSDWVMKERPWYIEGIKSEAVSFGEVYQDADSGDYIVSVFTNLHDKSGKVIGVVAADIKLDLMGQILRNEVIFKDGFVFAIDKTSNVVFSNKDDENMNGQIITLYQGNDYAPVISEAIETGKFNTLIYENGYYINVHEIPNTQFIIACVASRFDIKESLYRVISYSTIACVVGIILLLVVIATILIIILRPIVPLNQKIIAMSDLDLTQNLDVKSTDEIGEISRNLNLMSDKLKEMIRVLRLSTEEMSKTANENEGIARHLSDTSDNQLEMTTTLANSLEQISAAITLIAESAQTLMENVNDTEGAVQITKENSKVAVDNVKEGFGNMKDLKEKMQQLLNTSNNLNVAVEDVQNGLDGIDSMVSIIRTITNQTNLLSLNASIEAARAGEAGRGFAVVAEEIRKLADDCEASVKKIIETTDGLRSKVEVVSKETEITKEAVKGSNSIVNQVEDSFNKIKDSVGEIDTAMHDITKAVESISSVSSDMAASTEEQSAATAEMQEACESVRQLAEDIKEQSGTVLESGEALGQISNVVNSNITKFKL